MVLTTSEHSKLIPWAHPTTAILGPDYTSPLRHHRNRVFCGRETAVVTRETTQYERELHTPPVEARNSLLSKTKIRLWSREAERREKNKSWTTSSTQYRHQEEGASRGLLFFQQLHVPFYQTLRLPQFFFITIEDTVPPPTSRKPSASPLGQGALESPGVRDTLLKFRETRSRI